MSSRIPPFPILTTPYLLQYVSTLFEEAQRKYNSEVRLVAIPYLPTPSPSPPITVPTFPTQSTDPRPGSMSPTTFSTPSSPEQTQNQSKPKSPPACKCKVCGKEFSRQWLLQGHLRTHTGEKPFKCDICSKRFADKSNLRAHVQTHSGTKPHACSKCGKTFALKSYLSKHEESKCYARDT